MAKDPDPADFDDPVRLRGIIRNAERLGRPELVTACQVRIAELAGQEFDEPIERDFWEAVTMAEEVRTLANGKTTRLSRTRLKHRRDGAVKCIEDIAAKPELTAGFDFLVESGHPDLTFEAIALRHPQSFTEETLTAARAKLTDAGVDVDDAVKRERL